MVIRTLYCCCNILASKWNIFRRDYNKCISRAWKWHIFDISDDSLWEIRILKMSSALGGCYLCHVSRTRDKHILQKCRCKRNRINFRDSDYMELPTHKCSRSCGFRFVWSVIQNSSILPIASGFLAIFQDFAENETAGGDTSSNTMQLVITNALSSSTVRTLNFKINFKKHCLNNNIKCESFRVSIMRVKQA